MNKDVLKVKNLSVFYPDSFGEKTSVVSDVSFRIRSSETVGLVGESGSGKTQVSLSIIKLLREEAIVFSKGIFLNGLDLFSLSEQSMCHVRGDKVSMVFQEPMTSLNPVFTIGYQLKEAITCHRAYKKHDLEEKSLDFLERVKIPNPKACLKKYPHELSGGMRQRVLIAMALSSNPDLLIADEPTTALDVTTQAEILDLLRDIQKETGIAILFITHDLGVVAELCDYILVMYGGKIVEKGSVKSIFTKASHPYTKGLLASVPKLGEKLETLVSIPGINDFSEKNSEMCSFLKRCSLGKKEPCGLSVPKLEKIQEGHFSACFFAKKPESEEA